MKTTSIAPGKRVRKPGVRIRDRDRITTQLSVEFLNEPDHSTPANGRAEFINKVRPGWPAIPRLKLAFVGGAISGHGKVQPYGALIRELSARGHEVVFIELKQAQGRANGESLNQGRERVATCGSLGELKTRHAEDIRNADAVVIGSNVPEGIAVGEWVLQKASGAVGFHDLDTPGTLARLESGETNNVTADLIRKYDLYLSQTGGPELRRLEQRFGATLVRPFYPPIDTTMNYPDGSKAQFELGYTGDYTEEMQPALDELLLEPARNWEKGSFIVAGSDYPRGLRWPKNVKRRPQLTEAQKRSFYCSQKFVLSISTAAMIESGYSPAPMLFEAAACGTPIISDYWEGIESFFQPQDEILITHSSEETLYYLLETTETERAMLSKRARRRVLSSHTARHRAAELETHICDVLRPTMVSEAPGV